jgi:maleylpyruvate isomerase
VDQRLASARLERHLTGAAESHRGLSAMLDELGEAIDPARMSLLPAWTVGHVLTHLARNADSMTRVLMAADRGAVVDRYVGGDAGRDAEIEDGWRRPAGELVADVRASTERLEQQWVRQERWNGRSREATGREIPVTDLPFMRRREVEVHRADLGMGYEPADWPAEYVREELVNMEMRWNARRPMGLTGLPDEALRAPPHVRLAWLLGRTTIEGLEPAGVF